MRIYIQMTSNRNIVKVETEGRISLYDRVTMGLDGKIRRAKNGETMIGLAMGETIPAGTLAIWDEES